MSYYIDLFTGETWSEFRDAGADVTGFSGRNKAILDAIKKGDVFLCYMVGVQRWVGALEVLGTSNDKRQIWKMSEFPARFKVNPIVMMDPEFGVPMNALMGRVSFFESETERGKYKGFVRMSPNKFRREADGVLVLRLLRDASANPRRSPVDPRRLAYVPRLTAEVQKGKTTVPFAVTIPDSETIRLDDGGVDKPNTESGATLHTSIQYQLLRLGSELGYEVWVARNDRSKSCNGQSFADMPALLDELPAQFNEATTKAIAVIDVLWLKGKSIIAAFEVDSTTSVYSGLLRMSDLIALQPNLDIRLYIVAPDDRRAKVEQEILRPTFQIRDKPLSETCGFLSFEELNEKVDGARSLGLTGALKPEFLESIAEYFADDAS
jgi:hypothetical protein